MNSKEIDTVFIAKAVGISLVVVGHYYPDSSPLYWTTIRTIIYYFHMPLFFVISGYLYGFSPPTLNTYPAFVKKKAFRLLIPFVSISILYFLIKYSAGLFFTLKYPVTLHSLASILLNPLESYLPLLWFIYTLFIIFTIFPILSCALRENIYLLMAVVISLNFIEWTQYFCLAEVFHNLPFFTVGYIVGRKHINIDTVSDTIAVSVLTLSTLAFVLVYFECVLTYSQAAWSAGVTLLLGISGSIACIALSILTRMLRAQHRSYLKSIGVYSMSIYLLHTVFSGALRISFYQIATLPPSAFIYGASIAVAGGIVSPLLIEKYVFRKYTIAKTLVLGLG